MGTKTKVSLSISLFLLGGSAVLMRSAAFGRLPSAEDRARYAQSPQFDNTAGTFVNRQAKVIQAMRQNMSMPKMFRHWRNASEDVIPHQPLPTVTPDFEAFTAPSEALKVMWLGHSSIFMHMQGLNILVDPVLAKRTGPLGFLMKRFQPPVITPDALPTIDLVLITHDHYDHLDMGTIKAFQNTSTRFITPLGVAAHLTRWGIARDRIQELDWWQDTAFENLQITATPAQHFSGRGFRHQSQSLWCSWVIQSSDHRVFFSGDSGYDTHFKAIGEAFGSFDLAFIESGQYSVLWPAVHLHPAQSIQAFQDLNARRYFPIHWGMFRLSTHAWYEPLENISAAAQKLKIPLVTPRMGETAVLGPDYQGEAWWKPLI